MTNERRNDPDLSQLLNPAHAFGHPCDVVNDRDLTLNEKRAILASWASDACAVEAAPGLRSSPLGKSVRFDDIMDALRMLDRQANGHRYRPFPRRRGLLRPEAVNRSRRNDSLTQ
jgi:hypothetical protein